MQIDKFFTDLIEAQFNYELLEKVMTIKNPNKFVDSFASEEDLDALLLQLDRYSIDQVTRVNVENAIKVLKPQPQVKDVSFI